MKLCTTFSLCRVNNACRDGYQRLIREVGDPKKYGQDEPIPISRILESGGLDDAVWALGAVLPEQTAAGELIGRLFACDCAEHILPIFAMEHPGDQRVMKALETARRYARGEVSKDDLILARRKIKNIDCTFAAGRVLVSAGLAANPENHVSQAVLSARNVCVTQEAWDTEIDWQHRRFQLYLKRYEKAGEAHGNR
ncbi:MAG: putative immunity protein [Armatimonadota bacterium]